MTRDDLLRKVAGLACASLFDVKERLANDIDTHDASQRALIEQQAKEIAFHVSRVEALRRFLSEKIAECQNQAREIARLREDLDCAERALILLRAERIKENP